MSQKLMILERSEHAISAAQFQQVAAGDSAGILERLEAIGAKVGQEISQDGPSNAFFARG